MDTKELKPCPFCGETDALMVEYLAGTIRHPAYRVRCDDCGAATEYSGNGAHIAAWNTRASDATLAAQAAEIERLREALTKTRATFTAKYWMDGTPAVINYDVEALGPLIALLDATLNGEKP